MSRKFNLNMSSNYCVKSVEYPSTGKFNIGACARICIVLTKAQKYFKSFNHKANAKYIINTINKMVAVLLTKLIKLYVSSVLGIYLVNG